MLTHKAIHPSAHVATKKIHMSYIDPLHSITNIIAFITTSTFLTFTSAANDIQRPRESTFNIPIDEAVFRKSNWNLDPAQQELLLWHYRLGHIGMETVQRLLAKPHSSTALVPEYRIRVITPQNPKSSHCCAPLCAGCQFGRQKRTTPPLNAKTKNFIDGGVSENIVDPGRRVSVDLYVSKQKGRLTSSFGKEAPSVQYSGGSIFVDHASRFIFNQHQLSTTTAKTVRSKHLFESHCTSLGVKVTEYVTDNHPFHGDQWKVDCQIQNQLRHFSGVGAHHQILVERYIQTIFNMSRSMMIHFAMHWPQAADTNFWPFAVDQAIYIWNYILDRATLFALVNLFTSLLHFL